MHFRAEPCGQNGCECNAHKEYEKKINKIATKQKPMSGDYERTKGLNKTLTKVEELTVTKQDRTHGFERKNSKEKKKNQM